MATKKRSKKQVAEWSVLSLKGIATIAGLIWAYRSYRAKEAAAEAERRRAERMGIEDVAAGTAQSIAQRYM